VLPLEAAPAIVRVEELTRSSSEEGVDHLMGDLELGVSDALGMSLSEVYAWYFRDSDEGDVMKVSFPFSLSYSNLQYTAHTLTDARITQHTIFQNVLSS
jgi:hypothetical protein